MRTGRTQAFLETIVDQLSKGNSVFVAMLKTPKDYIDRLHRDFCIDVIATPCYVTRNYNITFEDVPPYRVWESGGEKQLTGYEFRKI